MIAATRLVALAWALAVEPSGSWSFGWNSPAAASEPSAAVDETSCAAGGGTCAGDTAENAAAEVQPSAHMEALHALQSGNRWQPRTLSVVLPCAGEGNFARQTVQAVSASVPGGGGGGVLAEIVVVDDGSTPPLEKFLPEDFREQHGVKLLRNSRTEGLIRAKAIGASLTTGDIIVFFDCHVAPQAGWHEHFLRSCAENYRRVVVPVITDLDIDTWTERSRETSVSKCYLTWDADFKWFRSNTPYIPVLSGGLLGISRRWWNETGGYDTSMEGWGGENIDQSLRTWLCGGEIVALEDAFVAHMWRRPEDERTQQRYHVNIMAVLRNRARAAMGWFDNFTKKLRDYPDMGYTRPEQMDLSTFRAVRERLSCRPFAWFLWRFRDVYEDAGLLPESTFRIRHIKSKLCLTYLGPAGTHPQGTEAVSLQPCGQPSRTQWPNSPPDRQRWHLANKEKQTGRCCSGLRVWSTDQCLMWNYMYKALGTSVCDITGAWGNFQLTDGSGGLVPGQLTYHGKCFTLDKKAGQVRPRECKVVQAGKSPKPVWETADLEMPLETRLYKKARHVNPELFGEHSEADVEG